MRKNLIPRMVALVVVTVIGFYYIGRDVLGWNVASSTYPVTVQLPRAGGVYVDADATYRGVPIGKVTSLKLRPDMVEAVVAVHQGTHIATPVEVNVRQLSALGEQYIDFVPTGSPSGFLPSGSTIPLARTTVPVPVGAALTDTTNLLQGIHEQDINSIEEILYNGFNGSAGDLRTIVVSGQSITNAFIQAANGTRALVNDGNTVLNTANDTSGQFATFTAQLAQLSATFAQDDNTLRALFANGSSAASGTDSILAADTNSIHGLISGLASAGNVSLAYQPAVQALFSVLPEVAGQLGSLASNGQIRGELAFNTDEPICTYVPSAQQALPTQATGAAPMNNTCPVSAPNLLQRGAQHAPVVP